MSAMIRGELVTEAEFCRRVQDEEFERLIRERDAALARVAELEKQNHIAAHTAKAMAHAADTERKEHLEFERLWKQSKARVAELEAQVVDDDGVAWRDKWQIAVTALELRNAELERLREHPAVVRDAKMKHYLARLEAVERALAGEEEQ